MDTLEIGLVIGLGTIGLWYLYQAIQGQTATTDCVPSPFVIVGVFVILYLLVTYV